MLILIGQFDSPFVRRVAVTLNHYDIPFDRHILSVFSDRAEVLRLNPLGKVPALILEGDQNETLVDSTLIIDYVDGLVPEERRLTPSSGHARHRVLHFAMVAMGMSERAVQLRTETVRRPQHLQSAEFIEGHHTSIRASLDYLEANCRGPFMVGDTLSQADISLTCALTHLMNRVNDYSDLNPWPGIGRIRENCETAPAFIVAPFDQDA